MKKNLLILVLFVFSLKLSAQDKKLPTFITDSLETYIVQGMKDWQIPGLSIAILKDGKPVILKGYGIRTLGSNEAVNEQTLFMIGSNTKLFTSTTLTILQEEGVLSIEDKVQKWMPEFKLKDPLASAEVRIADLLSHRLGFETFQGDFTYWDSNLNRAQVIQKMALIDVPYGFRNKWGYCNAAFVAAGEIIPKATGKSWEQAVQEKILSPLGMSRTLMLANQLPSATNVASPHSILEGKLEQIPVVDINNLAPAGSIISSASDMARWVQAQLDYGISEGKQVVPVNAISATRNPYSIMQIDPRDRRETHFYLYGLGVGINDRHGKLIYSHTGGVDGFVSSVMMIPEEKVGIVVLTNTDQNSFFQALTQEIADAFLGLPFQNYSERYLSRFKEEKSKTDHQTDSLKKLAALKKAPNLPLKSYTGTYKNELYGTIELTEKTNQLMISFSNHPKLSAKLEHLNQDIFLCTYSNPTMGVMEMPFQIEDGKVKGLTLSVSDFIEFTKYQFVKE